MKVINSILGILFLSFAYFQLNDPDPYLWVLLYVYIALVSFLTVKNKISKWFILPGMLSCVLWLGLLMPDFINWMKMGSPSITDSMKAEQPHIELTREFLGLAISLGVLFYLYFRHSIR